MAVLLSGKLPTTASSSHPAGLPHVRYGICSFKSSFLPSEEFFHSMILLFHGRERRGHFSGVIGGKNFFFFKFPSCLGWNFPKMSDCPWMSISVSEGESKCSQETLFHAWGCEEGLMGGLVSRLISWISTDSLCPECQPTPSRRFLVTIQMLSGGLPKSPAGIWEMGTSGVPGTEPALQGASFGIPGRSAVPGPCSPVAFALLDPAPAAKAAASPAHSARTRPAAPFQNTSASVAYCPLPSHYFLSFWTQLWYCQIPLASRICAFLGL